MFAMSEGIFNAHNLGGAMGGGGDWHQWVEARVAAKHPIVHREASTTNIFLMQSVSSDEDMWCKD